ncbi:MAG TPA: Rrf2 family transcriptional regulator [Caproiciproducens sp.]|nr:Rrf2 family transcriptional regulator [Caproiciproducens sp.]
MRISSKGRYGLAAMINMAQNYASNECITIISISEKLGISKIYLEQVFSLLKRAGLVFAAKGAQGGYKLIKNPKDITAYEILHALEQSLFEKTEESVAKQALYIEEAMQTAVFAKIDDAVKATLEKVTLDDLLMELEKQKTEGFMFYI